MKAIIIFILVMVSLQCHGAVKICPSMMDPSPLKVAGELSKFFECCSFNDGQCGCKDGMVQCCDGEVSFYCACDEDNTQDDS